MKHLIHGATLAIVFAVTAYVFAGCGQSDGTTNAAGTEITFDNSIAKALGISDSPITRDQAVQIALKAIPGTLLEVEEDIESGIPVIDVELQSDSGTKEVTIRASDGAVMKIEADDNDHDDGDQGDGDHDDGDHNDGEHED